MKANLPYQFNFTDDETKLRLSFIPQTSLDGKTVAIAVKLSIGNTSDTDDKKFIKNEYTITMETKDFLHSMQNFYEGNRRILQRVPEES